MNQFIFSMTKEEIEEKNKKYYTVCNTGEKPVKLTEEEISDLLIYGAKRILIDQRKNK